MTAAMSLLAFSYVLLWAGERARRLVCVHMAVLVAGVIVLDMGAQLSQVGNQTRIFGLVPSARSRLNTVYMTMYFSGAAVGRRCRRWRGCAGGGMACARWRWG